MKFTPIEWMTIIAIILLFSVMAIPPIVMSIQGDSLIEVKIISIQKPHAEGEGLAKTFYSSGCWCEKNGERIFVPYEIGVTGEVVKIRERILRRL
jgi:hypothetical protein